MYQKGRKKNKQDWECKSNEVSLLMVCHYNNAFIELSCNYISENVHSFDHHMNTRKNVNGMFLPFIVY